MTLGIQAGDGAQALDLNQLLAALDGFAVRTSVGNGCEPVNAEVGGITCRGGEVLFDGTVVSVSEQTVETPQNTSSNPRKDVAFIDSSGTLQLAVGDPAPAKPAGQQGRDTFQPAPPDLADTDAVVIAEGYVEPNNEFYRFADLSDRRVPSDFSLFDALVAGLTVSGTATVQDDVALEFGDGGDFAFSYDASADVFRLRDAAAGTTLLETSGQSLVELTQGVDLPDDTAARLGGGDEFTVEYDSGADELVITDTATNETVTFDAGDLGVSALSAATVDGDVVDAGRVSLPDDSPLSLGATDDAQVRFDSSTEEVVVEDTSTGDTLRFGAGTLAVDTVDATSVDATEVLTDAVDLPDSGPVRFGDSDDVSVRYDDSLGAWVVSFGSDELRVLPDGTLRIDGQLETVGDAAIGGDISFNGTFQPSDINADSVVSDAVDADVELSLPVFADNANAVAEDSQVWFNDGSGPNAAGIFFYDSGVIGPLATGAGSAPASLSGLQIDTTKDFGGFSLTGLGHDKVDVPQTRNLTVADFEGGTLPQDAVGDTAEATVQSSVALEGDFSLEISRPSSGASEVGFTDRSTTPQFGDSFEILTQLTDTSDNARINILHSDPTSPRFSATTLSLLVSAQFDVLAYDVYVDGSKVQENGTSANVSNNLNETLSLTGTISTDGEVSLTLSESAGSELATLSFSLPSGVPDSGDIQFTVSNNSSAPTAYFDGRFVERRVGEYYSNTQEGSVQLGNDVQPSGAIDAGPQEAIVSDSTVHGILRSDDALSAGSDVEIVEWDAAVGRRSLKGQADGNGGVYGLRSPLAERVTQQLSFESESLSDTTFRTQFGTTSHSASLSGFPRQLTVSHDGSDSGRGGLKSSVVTTHDSLAPFRATFRQVDFSNNNDDNELILAIHTGDADTDLVNLNTGVAFKSGQSGQGQDDFSVVQSGTRTRDATAGGKIPWDTARDISFEVDASQTRLLVDGELRSTLDVSPDGLLTPVIQLVDDGGNTTNETVSVEQITVEEL